MTLTYKQLMSWKPSSVEAAAEDVSNKIRKKYLNQQDEIDAGRVPGSWHGEAAGRAQLRFTKLRDGLNDLNANTSPIVEAAQTAAGDIRSAQRSAQHAFDAINSKQLNNKKWKVTEEASTDGVQVTQPALSIGDGDDADGTQADVDRINGEVDGLANDLKAALAKGEQADNDLSVTLNSCGKEQYDGGSGTISSAGLPPELRGLSPTDLANKMVKDPGLYGGYTDDLTPEQQTVLGRTIGTEADQIRNANGEIPVGDITQLDRALEAFGTDPEVATGFLNKVGPKGLLEINAKGAFWGGDRLGEDDAGARNSALGALQRALGATLAAGTHDVGDDDAGTRSHVSTDWKWDLLGAGDDKIKVGAIDVRGFQMLSPLLADGSKFDPEFLQSAGTSIVDYERNWDWHNHPEGPWDTTPGIMGDGIRWDYTQGTDPHNDPLGKDPIPGVLRSLADNPEASRQFFSSEQTYEPGKEPYDTLVQYLMYDRADQHHILNDFADMHSMKSPPLASMIHGVSG